MNQAKEIKTLIAVFQQETRSNNVLEFCVWLDNRLTLAQSIQKPKPKGEQN